MTKEQVIEGVAARKDLLRIAAQNIGDYCAAQMIAKGYAVEMALAETVNCQIFELDELFPRIAEIQDEVSEEWGLREIEDKAYIENKDTLVGRMNGFRY